MPSEDVNKLYIDHAVRCWDAERENAQRIEAQLKLGSTVAGLLLGLGFFKVEWFYRGDELSRVHMPLAVCLIKTCLVIALLLLVCSFAIMVRRPRRDRRGRSKSTASWHLYLGNPNIKALPTHAEGATMLIFQRIHGAYLSLLYRNELLRNQVKVARRYFIGGVFAIFIAIAFFIIFSVPPIVADGSRGDDGAVDRPTPGE